MTDVRPIRSGPTFLGLLGLLGVLVLTALLAACSVGEAEPDEQPTDAPAAARERVVTAAREAAEALGGVGEVAELSGAWTVCGSPPAEAVEYRASGRLSGTDQARTLGQAADALTAAGWSVTDEGTTPQPWANLERDGTTLELRPDPRRGSTAVAFAVADECVRVGDGEASTFDFDREAL